MSDLFPNEMERDYYDELFMQDAARLIDAELLEDAIAAQNMDVDAAWLLELQQASMKQLQKKKKKQVYEHRLKRIGRMAATFVIALSLLFSAVYFTVDAARDTLNNFMTGKTNRRATVVYPVNVEGQTYSLIPEGWRGPLYATWLPDGYVHATSGTQSDRHWWLCYSHKDDIFKSVCIYAWDETYKPKIDVESYELVSESAVQGVPATTYYDTKNETYTLIMVKNDLTIQILGTISEAEIFQIAESLEF